MKMTHKDLIGYLDLNGIHWDLQDGNIQVNQGTSFNNLDDKFTELPDNVIFNHILDLEKSSLTTFPDDLVLNGSIYLCNSNIIKLPVLNCNGVLYMMGTNYTLLPSTFVKYDIWSDNTKYDYLDMVIINGYIVGAGLLS